MKILYYFLMLAMVFTVSRAWAQMQEDPSATSTAKVPAVDVPAAEDYFKPGHYATGWSFLPIVFTSTGGRSGLLTDFSFKREQFIIDRFSVGGRAFYYGADNNENYGLGPTASYHFWITKYFNVFAAQELAYVRYTEAGYNPKSISDLNDFTGRTYLAFNWFILSLEAGYKYPIDSSEVVKPSAFWTLEFYIVK